MIGLYGIDPDMLLQSDNPIGVADYFGICNGRLMAKLPKTWLRDVYNSAKGLELGDSRLKKIEVSLDGLQRAAVDYGHTPFKGSDWLEDAEQSHWDLRAILALTNPRSHPKVLVPTEMNSQNALWHVEHDGVIARTADAIADAAIMLVTTATQLVFIDPYFDTDPDNDPNRFLNVIAKLMRLLPKPKKPIPIVLHVKHTNKVSFVGDCHGRLSPLLPSGVELEICRWSERVGGERFHARYIMNQLGGIAIDVGLDEGPRGQTTDIRLLGKSTYLRRWRDFNRSAPAFHMHEKPIVVKGTV